MSCISTLHLMRLSVCFLATAQRIAQSPTTHQNTTQVGARPPILTLAVAGTAKAIIDNLDAPPLALVDFLPRPPHSLHNSLPPHLPSPSHPHLLLHSYLLHDTRHAHFIHPHPPSADPHRRPLRPRILRATTIPGQHNSSNNNAAWIANLSKVAEPSAHDFRWPRRDVGVI